MCLFQGTFPTLSSLAENGQPCVFCCGLCHHRSRCRGRKEEHRHVDQPFDMDKGWHCQHLKKKQCTFLIKVPLNAQPLSFPHHWKMGQHSHACWLDFSFKKHFPLRLLKIVPSTIPFPSQLMGKTEQEQEALQCMTDPILEVPLDAVASKQKLSNFSTKSRFLASKHIITKKAD